MASAEVSTGYLPPAMTPMPAAAAALLRAEKIGRTPSSYRLRVKPRTVLDQCSLPCCVSCALAGAMEILNPTWQPLGALFHYHVTRYDDFGADTKGFLLFDKALLTLSAKGICKESLHQQQFTDAGATTRPSNTAYSDAVARRLPRHLQRPRYRRIVGASRALSICEELRKEHPVLVGFSLPNGYPRRFLDSNHEWLEPTKPSPSTSNHCALVRGYDDAKGALLIQDSRGALSDFDPLDQGCWWMGYRVVDSSVVKDTYYLY